jgi:hypothetical protein
MVSHVIVLQITVKIALQQRNGVLYEVRAGILWAVSADGSESRGAQSRERLCWLCPTTTENYRPDLSSERALHINKSATV